MRYVQCITGLKPAGAERIVSNLGRGLKRKGHEVFVISLQPIPEDSIIVRELRKENIEIRSLNVSKTAPWRILQLRSILKKIAPDIVHSHLIHANITSRINFIYPLINTVHIAERRKRKWWHFLIDKLTIQYCEVQTAVSYAVRNYHSNKIKQEKESMPVIYNGIDPIAPFTKEEKEGKKKQLGIENCQKIIGSVGRLDWQKGYDILFHLIPELSRAIPKNEIWALVIIGEGPQRTHLRNLTKSLPENIKIIMPGFIDNAAKYISLFDMFIMPSRYEGFGLTLIEAMSYGVPILASKIDSLPELIQQYQNGECIDFLDTSEKVIAKIVEYTEKEHISPCLAFRTEAMVENYIKLYEAVLAGNVL